MPAALERYVRPTWFIDSGSPGVKCQAVEVAAGAAPAGQPPLQLFYAVRDGIRYHPYSITAEPAWRVRNWLASRWVKATPAFNIELCERFGVRPLEFDGRSDALFHEYSVDGRRHMEYVAARGSFADLPLAQIIRAFEDRYGKRCTSAGAEHERDELFDPPARS